MNIDDLNRELITLRSPSRKHDEWICDLLWGERKPISNAGEILQMYWNINNEISIGIAPKFTQSINPTIQYIMPKDADWIISWFRSREEGCVTISSQERKVQARAALVPMAFFMAAFRLKKELEQLPAPYRFPINSRMSRRQLIDHIMGSNPALDSAFTRDNLFVAVSSQYITGFLEYNGEITCIGPELKDLNLYKTQQAFSDLICNGFLVYHQSLFTFLPD